MKYTALLILVVCFSSCKFFKKKKEVDKDVVAWVNDENLYVSDVAPFVRGLKGQDSINAIKAYAESWVRKKLLLEKAQENIADDDIAITQKVDDYKESLLLYEYEKAYIQQKLDTGIRQAELDEWYEKLKTTFPLEKDVYQVLFVRFKKDAPDLDKVRKWILKPKDEEDLLRLEGYSKEFAAVSAMDKGMWYDKETMLKNFPLTDYDVNTLASSKTFREYKKPEGNWFIRIVATMKSGEPMPMELVQSSLSRVIIEKRRQGLVEKVYKKVYDDGIKSKSFEILVK